MESLIDLIKSLASNENFKICVSSRPLVEFEQGFEGLPALKLHDVTHGDIRTYVDDRLVKNNKAAVREPEIAQYTVSSNRSMFPLAGGPIQLNMEHDHADLQVLLALGNVPMNNFNIVLQPIFMEEGIGKFCMGDVMVPSSLGIKDGDNGTIQVVTNGDPNGGLYNCADVTFSSSAPMGGYTNGTGVTATSYTGSNKNSNGSDSSMGSASGTGTAATASPSPTSGAGLSIELGLWSVVGAVFVAALA